MLIIMKFGGTSVGSVAALQQVADIVKKARERGNEVVVVVSAMSGVTDLLLGGARQAETGDTATADRARQEILAKHNQVIEALLTGSEWYASVSSEIGLLLDEFEALCHSISVLGELTPRALDVIAGMGERMSVRQAAAVLERHGVRARAVDATQIIVTDDQYGAASPLMPVTSERSQALLNPLLAEGITPVVPGFIGATEAGIPTTMGRGGSDYSATILARALGADEVWIWTDVDGVLTADPRIVPDARVIPLLSYSEVSELAYFGAKVLHPRTIRPVIEQDIPLWVKNTFNPSCPGTRIVRTPESTPGTVKAVAAIRGLSLVTVEGRGMMGVPGIAARTFSAVASQGASVLMISQSSSEQSICFVIPADAVPPVLHAIEEEMALELARRDVDRVWALDDVVIITAVGAGMRSTPGVAARVFGAAGQANVNVIAIAQGSSDCSVSIVVAADDAARAIQQIHTEVILNHELS
jgi:aspartate kinase